MEHKNIRLLKVPVNFVNVKYEDRNLFVAFLYLQRFSPYGRVHISNVPKRHFHHWITKLQGAGLIRREGEYYILKRNKEVWRLLNIKKVKSYGKLCYRFRKLPNEFSQLPWSDFKKAVIDNIQSYLAERKKYQIRERLKIAGTPIGDKSCSLFGSKASRLLFGYRSDTSGSKYRRKWFDVVDEPLKRREHFTVDGLPYYKYDCKKIYLTANYK